MFIDYGHSVHILRKIKNFQEDNMKIIVFFNVTTCSLVYLYSYQHFRVSPNYILRPKKLTIESTMSGIGSGVYELDLSPEDGDNRFQPKYFLTLNLTT
jgi:hypothetical protein